MAELDLLREYKRREFLQLLSSGGLLALPVDASGQTSTVHVRSEADGFYTVLTGKIEMGQGARTLLAQAAAEELGVGVDRIRMVMGDTGQVPDDGGTWASLTTPETVPAIRKDAAAVRGGALTPPEQWDVLGQPVKHLRGREIVTGALRYCADLKRDGMLHGVVVRPEALRAKLESAETSKAEALPGVKVVRDGGFLGVVAPDAVTAHEAAALVSAKWTSESLPSMEALRAQFKQKAVAPVEDMQTRYPPLIRSGDIEQGLKQAKQRLAGTYWMPYIAHAALETRAAIAEWDGDKVTIHCGKQAPFLVRAEVARALNVPEKNVRIIVSEPGGAFGSKQRGELEIEAARLARAAGRPVRVHWSREEEFQWAYARPAALIEIESGIDESGRLIAWRHRNYNAGAPGLRPPYDAAHQSNEFWRSESPIRQGSYRALAATANNFAREVHIDEWAAALKKDPLEFRLANISDARLKEALERAAERFGWSKRGKACGVACNLEKNGRLALFAEVDVVKGVVRPVRIVIAADFGAALNPDNLKNQIQGGVVQGLGGALWERLEFKGAAQMTKTLSNYRVPRFSDTPPIEVILIDRRDITPAGAGEAPITMPAPALANAVSAATGVRRRELPLSR